jgi:hypothetical protein
MLQADPPLVHLVLVKATGRHDYEAIASSDQNGFTHILCKIVLPMSFDAPVRPHGGLPASIFLMFPAVSVIFFSPAGSVLSVQRPSGLAAFALLRFSCRLRFTQNLEWC